MERMFRKQMLAVTAMVLLVFGLAPLAVASTIVFDFTDDPSPASSTKVFNESGLTLTVTAGGTAWGTSQINTKTLEPLVIHRIEGLGARDVNSTPDGENDDRLDNGFGPGFYNNFLELTFSVPVLLSGITMAEFDPQDDFGISVDGNVLADINEIGNATPDLTAFGTAFDRTGTVFRIETQIDDIGTTGPVFSADAMYLASITVVPEPSSLALLGLGGLFMATRRRFHHHN